jgi:DNA polymerase
MPDTLELDYESYCETDLTKLGLDRYTADPTNRPLMAAYAHNGGEWQHWQAHLEPLPRSVREALMDSSVEKWAFNAQFERVFTNRVMKIPSPVKNWRCTMILAYEQSFNGGLAEVGMQIGLPLDKQKLGNGKALIHKFCMPQKVTAKQPHLIRDYRTDPEDWHSFCEYNVGDCVAERAIKRRLERYYMPDVEWDYYETDQIINDRGFPVDLAFVRAAIRMSDLRKAQLLGQMIALTGLANPGSPTQLLPWLRARGFPFSDLQKESVEKTLTLHELRLQENRDAIIEDDCATVLRLRQGHAKLSVKKYDAILERVGQGDVMRYMFQFAGASRTCRWAGRGVQTQNLERTPKDLSDSDVLTALTSVIRSDDYEMLELMVDEPMRALGGLVRSSFATPEDEQFVVADLSSIETAVSAWLFGVTRQLENFKKGLDAYKDFATRFYNVPYDQVTKAMRQICKPPVLACCYRLGGGEIYDGVKTGLWKYAEDMGVNYTREESHKAVRLYRETYPEIVQAWKDIEAAVRSTMRDHKPSVYGYLTFTYEKPYLKMTMPSGRSIYYYSPLMRTERVQTGRMITRVARTEEEFLKFGARIGEEYQVEDTYERLAFTYMGKHAKTGQWVRLVNHGGRFVEQATQFTAREVFAIGMQRAHEDGYKLCAHAHDENIARVRLGDSYHTLDRLVGLMAKPIVWAPGLPLGAAGYVAPFYRKE